MDYGMMALLSTFLLVVLSVVLGAKYKTVSKKFTQAVELIVTIRDAVEDKKITDEEIIIIIKRGEVLLGRFERKTDQQ